MSRASLLSSRWQMTVVGCVLFAGTVCPAQVGDGATAPAASHAGASGVRMTAHQQVLQVLNRFTYGPRPGEVERVEAMGLREWFRQQLTPDVVDDAALEARLASYPGMTMRLDKLMEMYPSALQVRQAENGRVRAPGGDAAKAIYANALERRAQQRAKKGGKDADDGSGDDSLPGSPGEILAMAPAKRFKLLCRLSLGQLHTLMQNLGVDGKQKLVDGFTPQQVEALEAFNGPRGMVEAEVLQVKLLRDIYSERQLNEVMVDFWLNHFSVYMKKSQTEPYYIASYERDAIRPHALGNFENLLKATATSPAMLNYLDNASSVGPHSDYAKKNGGRKRKDVGLNENYGRELMELHTVGVNGGYTQRDVTEVAKVFTGWTVGKGAGRTDVPAVAEFDASKHEPGNKTVLGQKIKYGGQDEGMQVLHLLANSPQTAHFIATKLAVRFVADDPPAAMVDRMTQAFLDNHGDIRRVLVAMVNSPEFFAAAVYRDKVKTPQEYVVSAVRAAGADVESTAGLATAIAELGMPLFGRQTPDGYSMRADPWNSTAALVSRMNFALALATNRVAGVRTDFVALAGEAAGKTPEQKDRALEWAILHVPVSARTEKLIFAQTAGDVDAQRAALNQVTTVRDKKNPLLKKGSPAKSEAMDTQAALASGLIFGSPEFQRR